jgi:cell division protease FtsH
MTRQELLGKVDVLLGGRMAEEVIFGDISTGAHNDLQRATDIARAMVSEYGMGKTPGLSTYSRQNRPVFLSPEQTPLVSKEYREATAAKLDDGVRELITERASGVRKLLTKNRGLLESIAAELLNEEVMESDAFYRLIEAHRSTGPSSVG